MSKSLRKSAHNQIDKIAKNYGEVKYWSTNRLGEINYLNLSEMNVSDLSHLAKMKEELKGLKWLYLAYNNIEDLSPLGKLKGLEKLYISNNQVTDLRPIIGLHLNCLGISNNQITDLSSLSHFKQLEWLSIRNNIVFDFNVLSKMKSLKKVYL